MKKRSTALVRVELGVEQSERVRWLQQFHHGAPLTGLVTHAVQDWLEEQFARPEIRSAWDAETRARAGL